jgi:hypothetical protein
MSSRGELLLLKDVFEAIKKTEIEITGLIYRIHEIIRRKKCNNYRWKPRNR